MISKDGCLGGQLCCKMGGVVISKDGCLGGQLNCHKEWLGHGDTRGWLLKKAVKLHDVFIRF